MTDDAVMWIVIGVLALAFAGTPDLWDALISHVSAGRCVVTP